MLWGQYIGVAKVYYVYLRIVPTNTTMTCTYLLKLRYFCVVYSYAEKADLSKGF